MKIKIGKHDVYVAGSRCVNLDCFQMMSDKGTFVQGRGYTSYHSKERWVCGTRHLHGCPVVGVCTECSICIAPYESPLENGLCERCKKADEVLGEK
jgi:hypothetical protein